VLVAIKPSWPAAAQQQQVIQPMSSGRERPAGMGLQREEEEEEGEVTGAVSAAALCSPSTTTITR
jgi:hypothetical protein